MRDSTTIDIVGGVLRASIFVVRCPRSEESVSINIGPGNHGDIRPGWLKIEKRLEKLLTICLRACIDGVDDDDRLISPHVSLHSTIGRFIALG